jgi:hypothetical protein
VGLRRALQVAERGLTERGGGGGCYAAILPYAAMDRESTGKRKVGTDENGDGYWYHGYYGRAQSALQQQAMDTLARLFFMPSQSRTVAQSHTRTWWQAHITALGLRWCSQDGLALFGACSARLAGLGSGPMLRNTG